MVNFTTNKLMKDIKIVIDDFINEVLDMRKKLTTVHGSEALDVLWNEIEDMKDYYEKQELKELWEEISHQKKDIGKSKSIVEASIEKLANSIKNGDQGEGEDYTILENDYARLRRLHLNKAEIEKIEEKIYEVINYFMEAKDGIEKYLPDLEAKLASKREEEERYSSSIRNPYTNNDVYPREFNQRKAEKETDEWQERNNPSLGGGKRKIHKKSYSSKNRNKRRRQSSKRKPKRKC